ncbi:MAG: hypothetical protein ITD36_00165 [Nitrospira sp.]|nr:hypothetical protein [Nitrospira sp.]MBP0120924.1 hypothetical protein [Nitrospira sp.]MBP0124827.1 hypothetical protein [Nitrospira sp.]MBP0127036.1 hypothetical protein [Nitrospira sp.]MBP0129056.1 hypothetical protein [Nitrospira sp.]
MSYSFGPGHFFASALLCRSEAIAASRQNGAAILFWFVRRERDWATLDTEVVWTIQAPEEEKKLEEPEEALLLAL